MTYPREDLYRMQVSDFEVRDDPDTGSTLFGYAAVFDTDTVINGWEGHFVERISPGAFRKTLQDRGNKVKVLFNHGFDPQIGDKPLGKPRVVREDQKGLYVEVPLDDTSYNKDIKALLRSGALDGMSFRFTVVRDDWNHDSDLPVRTINELKLFEFGPVTFPAYEATQAGIRSRDGYDAWLRTRTLTGDAAESGTSPVETDTPPLAPVGLTDTQMRERLALINLRLKEIQSA